MRLERDHKKLVQKLDNYENDAKAELEVFARRFSEHKAKQRQEVTEMLQRHQEETDAFEQQMLNMCRESMAKNKKNLDDSTKEIS